MKLPTLYKKTSTGAIQEWTISVTANIIYTKFGQVNGKIQHTEDVIHEGKNIGKKNETTASQQALLEAKAKWTKQKKKGYVENIKDAEAGEVDSIIQGGVAPMLAQSFAKHGDKITYPAYIQPKLDGVRCIAIIKDGTCTLWTRTRKPITSVPHIIEELEERFGEEDIILDGELYNHSFKDNFEHIIHLVRQETPDPNHKLVEYHVYDMVHPEYTFSERANTLEELFGEEIGYVLLVQTEFVFKEEDTQEYFKDFQYDGYEGAMLRNANGLYVNKRSYDLQKVKEFEDAEFDILDVEEGRGKLQGHVGSFICTTAKGNTFNVKLEGNLNYLKECFNKPSLWKGKKLTVRYQGLSGKNKVPRFPVGVAIRDYE